MMRGSYALLPLGGKFRWGRVFLVLLYTLTFYLGPQFGSSDNFNQDPGAKAFASGPGSAGFYWLDEFNGQFEYNDL